MTTINDVTFNMKALESVGTHRNVPNEEPGSDESFITDMGYTGLVLRMTGYEKTLAKYDEVIHEFMKPGAHALVYRTGWQFNVYSTQLVPLLGAGIVDNFFPYELVMLTSNPYRESSTLSCRAKSITANNQEWSAEDMPCNNLLDNWSFEDWSDGASSAPDGWTAVNSPIIAREDTIVKIGTHSCKLTGSLGNSKIMYTFNDFMYYRGRQLTFGCWIYSSIASASRMIIRDSVDLAWSLYHTGSGTWEWITVTHTVNSSATFLDVAVYPDYANNGDFAYFDGAVLVEGDSIPDNTFIRDIDTDGSVDAVPDIQITSDSTANEVFTQLEKL